MKVFKVQVETTNGLKNTTFDKKHNKYIDAQDGYIYVTQRDIVYVMDNLEWKSIKDVGFLFEKPTELLKGEQS